MKSIVERLGVPKETVTKARKIMGMEGGKTFSEMSEGKAKTAIEYGALKTYRGVNKLGGTMKKAINKIKGNVYDDENTFESNGKRIPYRNDRQKFSQY